MPSHRRSEDLAPHGPPAITAIALRPPHAKDHRWARRLQLRRLTSVWLSEHCALPPLLLPASQFLMPAALPSSRFPPILPPTPASPPPDSGWQRHARHGRASGGRGPPRPSLQPSARDGIVGAVVLPVERVEDAPEVCIDSPVPPPPVSLSGMAPSACLSAARGRIAGWAYRFLSPPPPVIVGQSPPSRPHPQRGRRGPAHGEVGLLWA